MLTRLKEIRKKYGYSYSQMANFLKISKPYYWQIENRYRNLSYKMAFNIAQIFKLKPDELFYEDIKKEL